MPVFGKEYHMNKKKYTLSGYILFGLCLFTILFSSFNAEAQQDEPQPVKVLRINPFILEKARLAPGSSFRIHIDERLLLENGILEADESLVKVVRNIQGICLKYEIEEGTQRSEVSLAMNEFFLERVANKSGLTLRMPSWQELTRKGEDMTTQSPWKGWLSTYDGSIEIRYNQADKGQILVTLPIEIPDRFWALSWGIFIVLISFVIIWVLKPTPLKAQEYFAKNESEELWNRKNKIVRFLLYPLNFAITPLGTYSISLAQVLLWTYITIFGIVYVHWLTGSFLDITKQVLILLGIGGGTALAAKVNAVSRAKTLPAKYTKLVTKKRIPQLKDLVSIGGQPNIYKMQMLVFTSLTGCIVVLEILKNNAFPVIPDNLVTLMGISGAVYLGNEVTQKNVWETVQEKIKAIEKHASDNNLPMNTTQDIENIKITELEELKQLLTDIYS